MQRKIEHKVRAAAAGLHLTQAQMLDACKAFLGLLKDAVFAGEEVALDGLGELRVSWLPPRFVPAPFGGGEPCTVPALPTVRFRPYDSTKQQLAAQLVGTRDLQPSV